MTGAESDLHDALDRAHAHIEALEAEVTRLKSGTQTPSIHAYVDPLRQAEELRWVAEAIRADGRNLIVTAELFAEMLEARAAALAPQTEARP